MSENPPLGHDKEQNEDPIVSPQSPTTFEGYQNLGFVTITGKFIKFHQS